MYLIQQLVLGPETARSFFRQNFPVSTKNGFLLAAIPCESPDHKEDLEALLGKLSSRVQMQISQRLQSRHVEKTSTQRLDADSEKKLQMSPERIARGFIHVSLFSAASNEQTNIKISDLFNFLWEQFSNGLLQALFTRQELLNLPKKHQYFRVVVIPCSLPSDSFSEELAAHEINLLITALRSKKGEVKGMKESSPPVVLAETEFKEYDFTQVSGGNPIALKAHLEILGKDDSSQKQVASAPSLTSPSASAAQGDHSVVDNGVNQSTSSAFSLDLSDAFSDFTKNSIDYTADDEDDGEESRNREDSLFPRPLSDSLAAAAQENDGVAAAAADDGVVAGGGDTTHNEAKKRMGIFSSEVLRAARQYSVFSHQQAQGTQEQQSEPAAQAAPQAPNHRPNSSDPDLFKVEFV